MRASRFQALRDRSAAIVDRQFAEPVQLAFFKKGRLDASRQSVEFDAVLRVGGGKETNAAGGYSHSWRTQLAAGRAELHIDLATYVGPVATQGDRVRALARKGQPWFEILRVDDRGDTRMVFELGEI